MLTKKLLKVAEKFYCEGCDYTTSKSSSYKKHLSTAKHIKLTNLTEKSAKVAYPDDKHICDSCNKQYKSRMGLWQHRQKCGPESEPPVIREDTPLDKTMFIELIKQNQTLITSNQEFKELIMEQQHENQELQKQLLEVVKEGKTINNTQNNKFNLNFFLNEQCKDAINMSEFMENMTLDMEDLEETGRLGYVNGISRIFVNKLRELDTYKRPLHCTDLKRETLYIRENDEWSKEENSKEKLKELVNRVANKNCKTMKQWTDENPNYTEMDSIENQEFMKLSNIVLGGFGEYESKQFRDKIIRSVIKEVFVCKN
jgi:hypothetical protein